MTSYAARFADINESIRYSIDRQANELTRFTAQLDFANQLRRAHPELAGEWEECIIEAGRIVQEGLKDRRVDLEDLVARGETALRSLGRVAKTYTLLCVSHAHIDMNWMWSWPETVAVTNDTFQTMLTLMDEFPGFIFSQSQASVYHLIEKYNPRMFDAIRQRIQEGRWEVTASQWVEGDKNMVSGESISRHLLYTREYLQGKFGLSPEDVQVDFEPDTFGHPATLPSILSRGGVRYYYHCRGSHGPHLYWWVGPDGARILAFNDVKWYMGPIEPQIAEPLTGFASATGLKHMPVFYGVGNHGGGPTRRDLQRLLDMNQWPVFPNLAFSTLHHFFRLAESEAQNVPSVVGERNFVFTGCYTSQARHKWANRHGENLLFTAEVAAVLGDQLADVEYPHENLREAWIHLLFNQFHDILPGSGVRETREYALGHAQQTHAAAGIARTNALRALSARIDTASLSHVSRTDRACTSRSERSYKAEAESAQSMGAGVGYGTGLGGESSFSATRTSDRAFMIFNPLPHPRNEVITAKLWNTSLDEKQLVVTSKGTEPCRVQVLDRGRYWGHEYLTLAFPVEVPALGYRTVCISDRLAELRPPPDDGRDEGNWSNDEMGAWRKSPPPDDTMENEFLKVRLDPASGGIASLLDKHTGREWVPEEKYTGILQYCVEANAGMTAWVIGQFLTQEDLLNGGTLQRVHSGPYVETFRWTRFLNDTALELDVTLKQGVPRVEFRLRVDWREIGHPERGIPHLKVRFPLAVTDPRPRYEIPFGSVRRDLFDGEQVPALRWVDLSDGSGRGVTLVNSAKYGFSLEEDSLGMTLLRASIDPDPLPDLGEHIIQYALVPHGEDWTIGDCMQVGEGLNIPLVVTSCGFQDGDLPSVMSFAALKAKNVRLAAIKKGQATSAIVIRLVEVEGKATEARVALAPEVLPPRATAVEVDTLERPVDSNNVRLDANTLVAKLSAFGVVTAQISGRKQR